MISDLHVLVVDKMYKISLSKKNHNLLSLFSWCKYFNLENLAEICQEYSKKIALMYNIKRQAVNTTRHFSNKVPCPGEG